MKLRNKDNKSMVGVLKAVSLTPDNEIGRFAVECEGATYYYDSLEQVYNKWEDYKEDTLYLEGIQDITWNIAGKVIIDYATGKEAEQAFERLKAWRRLKKNGLKFEGIKESWIGCSGYPASYMRMVDHRYIYFNKSEDVEWLHENWGDLELLFGRENDT